MQNRTQHTDHYATLPPPEGFLRLSQITGRKATKTSPAIVPLIPIDRSTLWDWIKQGKFPQAVKLGDNTTVWRAGDVYARMEDAVEGDPLAGCVARAVDLAAKKLGLTTPTAPLLRRKESARGLDWSLS